MNGRMRAGLVIAVIAVCSALAGAAIDRAMLARGHRGRGGPGGRMTAEQETRRRHDMVDRLTRDLGLSATQRSAVDSIMQRTDSTLREMRREMQPRVQQVLESSSAQIAARLDSTQRAKFEKINEERRRRGTTTQAPAVHR